MDAQFTRLYQDELTHLRELGHEFAQEQPKIAARLALDGMEVADPYVERLLEGFAFLTARVRMKLDAEQPRLIEQLLESLYPNFLAPVPSMMIVRLQVDTADPNLASGYSVPRGSALHSTLPRGQDTLCEFRTASALRLWPIELVQAQYFSQAPELKLSRWPGARAARGGLRLRLRCGGGLRFDQLALDRLPLYLSAPDDVAYRLHELLLGAPVGTLVLAGDSGGASSGATSVQAGSDPAAQWGDASSVQPLGYGADEALLPESLRAFSGHRLLQELAALPQRFLFFEICGLAPRLARTRCSELDVVVLFNRADPALEALVDAASVALHCTPAVNLFPKRLDRLALGPGGWEYHAVPDRTRPMDYEVHSITRVQGHGAGNDGPLEFMPLYHWQYGMAEGAQGSYTLRREPRRPSQRQRQQGSRVPSYMGEEVFVALGDPGHGPFRETLRQLSVQALVSNRDLPALLPQGGPDAAATGVTAWRLDTPGPVTAVHNLRGPTRPASRRPAGDIGWQLVASLSRQQAALDDDAQVNAQALRELLKLHGPPLDAVWLHQAEGVRALHARAVVRRLPYKGPLCFGSGVEMSLEVDEQAFQGASAFLLASVLETFFARHAAINSFSQLLLRSTQRGLIMSWPPRVGLGAIV